MAASLASLFSAHHSATHKGEAKLLTRGMKLASSKKNVKTARFYHCMQRAVTIETVDNNGRDVEHV